MSRSLPVEALLALPSRRAAPAWAAALLLLGAGPASALSFHTTAQTSVAGNCRTQTTSQNTGGTFVNATQASSTATGPINSGACAANYLPGPWSGTSTASANLSTGQLKVFASGDNSTATITLFPNASPLNLDIAATASFSDTFRLIPPSGYSGPNPVIDIVLSMTASTDTGAGPAGSNAAHLDWFLQTSTATVPNLRTNRCFESGAISNPQPCFFLGGNNLSAILHRLTIPLTNLQVALFAQLNARVFNNGTADASATGTLSLDGGRRRRRSKTV